MGWNHALDIAQRFFEDIVCRSLEIPSDRLLRDGAAAPSASAGVAAVYVDNFACCSSNRKYCEEAFDKVKKTCKDMGIPTHDEHDEEKESSAQCCCVRLAIRWGLV